jgi:SAM-dependent methyltransferase
VDFGPSAADYARHRKGFPPSFFARLPLAGDVLDLGSGTGTLARGYLERGARAVALDLSGAMLREAIDLPCRVVARAEACPFAAATFDAVVAGQCWHWFDGPAVASECRRLLRPAGLLAIAHYDYLALGDNVAAATERLILEFNPGWAMPGSDGIYDRWRPHLEGAGFRGVRSVHYDEDASYSHEAWRGRIRACNGVLALDDARQIQKLDRTLAELLVRRFPEPLTVPHRIFVISGRRP